MKSLLKRMNYSSILMNWIIFTVIYCKTVQFTTVNLNYSNLLATVLPVSYCKNPLKCLTVYRRSEYKGFLWIFANRLS